MLPTSPAEVGTWLAKVDPDATDGALRASLPLSIGSSIEAVWHTRPDDGSDHAGEPFISDWRLDGEPDPQTARETLALCEALLQPAGQRECAKAVGRLRALTVTRETTAEDLALVVETLAGELTAYPIDVVRDACRAWASAKRFFPAWAELRALCEDGVRWRRVLARELRRYLDSLD